MYELFTSQKLLIRIARHMALFLSMVLLFSWVAYSRTGESSFISDFAMVFTNAFFFFAYAYITVYLLIPYFLVRRKIALFFASFLAAGLLLSLMKFLFSDFVFYQAIASEQGFAVTSVNIPALLVNTKDMTFIVAVFALVKYARDHYILDLNNRELQRKELEAELQLIEHQMDPHVIFNNFNNLYSISIYRPELLKSTVKKLKTVLHYLFNESKRDKVLLEKEVAMIENYIGLEKLRYGNRLKVQYTTEGEMNGVTISPMILYAFIENCFVYGAGENPSQTLIRIELSIQNTHLRFVAAHSLTDQPGSMRTGQNGDSLENSIRRLELSYPNRHRLTIRERKEEHEVELHVSL